MLRAFDPFHNIDQAAGPRGKDLHAPRKGLGYDEAECFHARNMNERMGRVVRINQFLIGFESVKTYVRFSRRRACRGAKLLSIATRVGMPKESQFKCQSFAVKSIGQLD